MSTNNRSKIMQIFSASDVKHSLYSYPKERIDVERPVYFGSRNFDLANVIFLQEDLSRPYMIFEVKNVVL
jgi:hypothetical protein